MLGVNNRISFGQDVGGHMVVGDDEIDTFLLANLSRVVGRDAVIYGHDEARVCDLLDDLRV